MTTEHESGNNRRRPRTTVGRLGAAIAVFAVPIVLAGPARAQIHPTLAATAGQSSLDQPPTLGGWNVSADGNAVDIVIDNQTGLAGIHPFSEADVPEAQTQFATGPFGSGLATVFWPGSAGGNFGSLSSELGIPPQLEPIASKLNDPVRASAQYPLGPATADYPSGSSPSGVAAMHATAQPGGTTADASITNTGSAAVLTFASAKGSSTSTAAKTAQGDASSAVNDVSLLGGLIDIGSITGTAEAVSDGSTGSGSASTHVTGVTVLGQKASIGSDGLVLPDFPSALGAITGPVVQNAVSQVISGLGVTITEFPSTRSANGSGFTASSGGVSIGIDPPSSAAPILEQAASTLAPLFPSQAAIIPTLPGLLQGMTLTITLGRATASTNASAAYVPNFTPIPMPSAPGASGPGDLTGAAGATGSAAAASAPSGAGATTPSLAGTPAPAGGTTGGTGAPTTPVAQPPAALINLSQPLGAGLVLLAILATLAVGYGLWRLGRMLLPADTGPACPLGQDQT